MKTLIAAAVLVLAATAVLGASPADKGLPRPIDSGAPSNFHYSSGIAVAKSDTVDIFGGPDRGDGKFQHDVDRHLPDWEGWTGVDLTSHEVSAWHIDPFNSPTGTNAMWCGEILVSCGPGDPPEGYRNNYEEILGWYGSVGDNGMATDVTVVFDLNMDAEPGYDFLYLEYEGAAGWVTAEIYNLWTYDEGSQTWIPLLGETVAFTVQASDLTGPAGNQVHLRFRATSDGGWSDEDCMWPTSGHSQIDNISVTGTNGLPATLDDFESGIGASNWQAEYPVAVGDFSNIWPALDELDICRQNRTPQAAFIDDGVVVPCTGGSLGSSWTYGPGGYTHNLTGGCAGPTEHAMNEIWSPVIAYADEFGTPLHATHEGIALEFDVMEHLPINNGMFWVWHISSSDDDGATWSFWEDRNFVYYGLTDYSREHFRLDDLIVPGTTHVRIALGINELGWVWGFTGTDGTPAPYFDNVRLRVFEIGGPFIAGIEGNMASDGFPASGTIDYMNLGANSIRFDMAFNIDQTGSMIHGDTIVFDAAAVRAGAALVENPRLHYVLDPNPLFDSVRTHPTSGSVLSDLASGGGGYYTPTDRFAFDLPDEGFLFPGDVIHYYISATDDVAGDMRTSTLPETLDGFGVFPGDPGYEPLVWPTLFTVRGLPSLRTATPGDHPSMLFYNDSASISNENEWLLAFEHLGMVMGEDYDVYTSRDASTNGGTGLGGRATAVQLEHYQTLLYSSGSLMNNTMTTPDPYGWGGTVDADDVTLVSDWLLYGRNLLLTGDHVLSDLRNTQGSEGAAFLAAWLPINMQGQDVRPYIGGQAAPLVEPVPGNVVGLSQSFVAAGICPSLNTFDMVEPQGTTTAIAEWTAPDGSSGAYPLAAGLANTAGGSTIVALPVDLMNWWSAPDYSPPIGYAAQAAARDVALDQILTFFGEGYSGSPTAVDTPMAPSARAYPNPFNPSTTIEYAVPSRTAVDLRVYNVRGELVRVLVDGVHEPGVHQVAWNGKDGTGRTVASGVYFYQTSIGGEKLVNKLTMMK